MDRVIPIVVVAYNRAKSVQRLLDSLNRARYERDDIPLIISIDRGENNQDVLEVAERFVWKHGEKTVVYQKENLKLRKHILKCADYSIEYGSVIILEDDLYVSEYFYDYAAQALDFSEKDDRIGGVSLYNHRFNVEASEPFEAIDDGYDNWYFQFASSWGQAWTKKQWCEFKTWYEQNPKLDDRQEVPAYVRRWPSSSWLKYFIAFLIEKNKYFIYPRKSLTTNFGDAGTHVNTDNTNHQVPLQNAPMKYVFSDLENSGAVYDAFFENITLKKELNLDVCIDLYGMKPIGEACFNSEYLLTRRILPRKIVKEYACSMRPHEENILRGISGEDFFLYDMQVMERNDAKQDSVRKMQYNLRYIDRSQYRYVIRLFIDKTIGGLKRRLKRR